MPLGLLGLVPHAQTAELPLQWALPQASTVEPPATFSDTRSPLECQHLKGRALLAAVSCPSTAEPGTWPAPNSLHRWRHGFP